ncbi:MAG: endonuclease/exonuclease/phosphatase family protein [Anaerolineae bacterium]|nr:endonuclease/exonuclease/phosphatase family protein [Anaerolineae bacterium]
MPKYRDLDPLHNLEHKRITERLLKLRQQLNRDIPVTRTLFHNLLLATWNIREFDAPAYGARVPEAIYYIAEIIARFDLVAVQEVRSDLSSLKRVLAVLGDHWHYLITDVSEGAPGNDERMAFLYDSRKVRFGGLASELVLPPLRGKDAAGNTVYTPVTQIARTPFLCGFEANWANFMLCTVHVLYGESSADDPRRVAEIEHIAGFLRKRTEDERAWSQNLILLGDFNIFSHDDLTMTKLLEAGFSIPEGIDGPRKLPASNVPRNKFYDQIMFRVRDRRFGTIGMSGAFDYYETVFRDEDEALYIPYMGEAYHVTSRGAPRQNKSLYYQTYWRTHQMSDHLPLWVELRIDYSDDYLERKLSGDA